MEWGPHLKALTSQLKPGETLSVLEKRPLLTDATEPFWDAFMLLSNSRGSSGFGPNAIAFSDIVAFINLFGIAGDDAVDDYVYFIQLLDGVYLNHKAHEASKELNKGQGHVGQRGTRIHNRQ